MKRLTRNLINASIDAFVLGLETVNRPSVAYRLQASTIMFCNAWELLLKAALIDRGENIHLKKARNRSRQTISLDQCIGRIFTDMGDAVRANLETLEELRNEAAHYVLPFVPPVVMGLLQATVINYTQKADEWFSVNLSQRIPLGMMALVFDFDPADYSTQNPRVRRKLTADAVKWIDGFQHRVRDRAASQGPRQNEYVVEVDFKLALIKNPKKADIVLGTGDSNSGIQGAIIEVPRDLDRTHPLYEGGIVNLVNAELAQHGVTINGYDVRAVRKARKISDKGEFVWRSDIAGNRTRYANSFADWLVSQYRSDPGFFSAARAEVKT